MADLVTHVLTAQWLTMAKRQIRPEPFLVVGVMLPDLMANVPIVLLRLVGFRVSQTSLAWLPDALTAFHSPLLYALLISWFCALLPESKRKSAFMGLGVGGLLHIAVDLLQKHVVPGAYFPGYPLARQPWTHGFLHPESSLLVLPVLLGLTIWVARSSWWRAQTVRPQDRRPQND